MPRKLCVLLCVAVLLLTTTAVSSAATYAPPKGVVFNNPYGSGAAQNRILVHVRRAISHTPRGETIRLATYSFDRPDIGDALLAAHRRGVHIQMVLNDNWTSKQTRRLQRVIGKNTEKSSFVKICYRACRGGAGNQHMKFYLFTKSGSAKNVVMVGSANLTGYGAKSQWNDMFTLVGRPDMMRAYSGIFRQLAADRRLKHPYVVARTGDLTSRFYPHPNTTASTDPMMRRLNQVRCAATRNTGYKGRTLIRITMYGWVGERGNYLADKVAGLSRRGCDVRAIVSNPGRQVVGKLNRGGVLVKSADFTLRDDGSYRNYTHEKWMILNGNFGGHGYRGVWTGSQNWSGLALMNDEVTLDIPRAGAYFAYARHFNSVWNTHARWLPGASDADRHIGQMSPI